MRRHLSLFGAALLSTMWLGCGGPAGVDAGIDGGAPDAGPPPFAPTGVMPPAPPDLTPCPDGWREVPGDVVTCDPWPPSGRADCGVGEAHFPGEPGCRSVTAPCPADGLPADLPAGAVYVRAGEVGGDGSRGAPYGTLNEALDAAGPDAVIGLGVGTYPESAIVGARTLTIAGACHEAVIAPPGVAVALIFSDSDVTLRDLTLRDAARGIVSGNGTLRVGGVVFEDIIGNAISSFESTLVAEDLLIRNVGTGGFLIRAGQTSIDRVAFERGGGPVFSLDEGEQAVRDVSVSGLPLDSPALMLANDASITFERLVAESEGVPTTTGFGGTTRFVDSVLQAPEGGRVNDDGWAILGTSGAAVELERTVIRRSGTIGVAVADEGGRAVLTDVLIEDVIGEGNALEVGLGTVATLDRVWIRRSGDLGVLVFGAGTVLDARDLVVEASQPSAMGLWGRGMNVQSGAHVSAERVRVDANHEVGIVAASAGTEVSLVDLTIRDTQERGCVVTGCDPAGIGMGAYLGGALTVERFSIEGNALVGVQIASDGRIALDDGVVTDNPIGANVQVEGYDLSRLTDRVEYRDNGVNLESSELYIPAPTVP